MDGSNGSRWRIAGICALLAFAFVLALGCGRSSQESKASRNTPAVQGEVEANKTAGEAIESAAAQRRRLQEQAEEARDDIELELSDARRELAALPSEARGALQAAIDRGESAQKALAREIEDAQRPSAEPWEETREKLSAARDKADEARREIAALLEGHEEKTAKP